MEPAERSRLEARVFGTADPDPADVAALRALIEAESAPQELPPAPDPHPAAAADVSRSAPVEGSAALPGAAAPHPDPVHPARPARAWLAAAAVCVVVAGLAGAGIARAALGSSADPGADTPASTTARSTDDPTAFVYDGGLGAVAATTSDLGSEYFDRAQGDGDAPPVLPQGIDPASTRRVLAQFTDVISGSVDQLGSAGDQRYGMWVARGSDGSYCLLMEAGADRAASSCVSKVSASADPVRLELIVSTTVSVRARWAIGAGIIEVTPVTLARTATPLPTPTGIPGRHASGTAAPTP